MMSWGVLGVKVCYDELGVLGVEVIELRCDRDV